MRLASFHPFFLSPGRVATRLVHLAALLFLVACGRSSSGGDSGDGDSNEVVGCSTTADCGEGGLCRQGKCLAPTSCSSSEECGFNRECDVAQGICVECLVGNDCAPGQTCLGNVCRDSCQGADECGSGLTCSENGYCAECRGDEGCAGDEHCRQGACVADVCGARGTQCTEEGTVLVCSERGDGQVELECPGTETCGTEQGPAWCQSWICTPSQSFCSEDGAFANTCSVDGLTLAASVECAATNSVCIDGYCEPIICEPYDTYCKDGDVYTCSSDGTAESITQGCFSYQYCDEGTASCQAQICTPGAPGCESGQPGTCNALGSGFENLSTCEVDQACDGGACEPILCEAGQRFCDEQTVRQCNALGTASSLYQGCSAGQFCNDSGINAVCSTDLCTPSLAWCDGNILGTCNAEGSGLGPGTTDCTTTSQVCAQGECKDVICTASERLCVGGDVHVCVDKGSATQLYDACTTNEYCEEATATCQTRICNPGLPGCNGQMARICNADGSGWEAGGTDCTTLDNQVCDAGSCEEVICSPGGRFCDGTEVRTCNVLGTGGTLYQACSLSHHCYESSPTFAYCRIDQCTASAPVCNGELATTCESDGSGPIPGGTNCTLTGDKCWSGSCEPQVCTPGVRLCVGGHYHNCTSNGTATSLYDSCTTDEYCDDGTGCEPQQCVPDGLFCNGEVAAQCASNGSGPLPGGTDCAASGQICHAAICKDVTCVDGEFLCEAGNLYQCVDRGTYKDLRQTCDEDEYCEPGAHTCVHFVCDPESTICMDFSTVGTCDSEGRGYENFTTCEAGSKCQEGVCSLEESLCTLEGNTWSLAYDLEIFGTPSGIGADLGGNIFVHTDFEDEQFVTRYSSAGDTWSDTLDLADGDSGTMKLAVSPNGGAMVLHGGESLWYRVYDVDSDTWGPQVYLHEPRGTIYTPYLFADAAGGFFAAWTRAASLDPGAALGVLTARYRPGYGFETPLQVSQTVHTRYRVDYSLSGHAALVVQDGHSHFYSILNPDATSWTGRVPYYTNNGFSISDMVVSWTSGVGESAVFGGYEFGGLGVPDYTYLVNWDRTNGLAPTQLIDNIANIPMSFIPTGDGSFGLRGTLPLLVRDPSTGTWSEDDSLVPDHVKSGIGFATGEAVAFIRTPYGFGYYSPDVGWTTEDHGETREILMTPLPGCRAVALVDARLETNEVWIFE